MKSPFILLQVILFSFLLASSVESAPSWAKRGSGLTGLKCEDCGFHTRCPKCGLTWYHGPCSCQSGGGKVPPASEVCLDCEEKAAARAALETKRKELQGKAEELRREINSLDATGKSSELAAKISQARQLLSRVRMDRDLAPSDRSNLISRAEAKIAQLETASRDYQARRAQLMSELNQVESESLSILTELAGSQ